MNNKYKIFFFLIFVLTIPIISSCTKKKEESKANKIGLVFDVGGRGDKSFNDAAYRGLERAKVELGIDFEVIDPGDGSDRESALRILAARKDIGLIFGVGFIFTDDITNIAKEFPEKKFVCIDYTITEGKTIPPNLLAITFKEEEGSFLVGAIAGLITKTKTVGFVGGMQSALIKKFEIGFTEGVKYVCNECNILTAYVGVTGEGFKNAPKAKEIALTQYNNKADIIYHASGLSGIGVFEAARETKKFAIGVDLNQWDEAPGYILTSMTKQVDEMILLAIKDYVNGNFKGGVKNIGLKEKGVNYVYDDNNKHLIPENVHKKVEEIREKIINGEIIVKSK
ncbi:MAG: BMP family ABC transporter substrate-binding protein [Ignavibacteria bacterium]|nr:BMP family ABC transporter substrate-binding protein [Ignavibacteria bacterium]